MKILVACEESQAVCKAFRAKGHEAYSCDIIDCSGGHPEWHIQCDALELINGYIGKGYGPAWFTTNDGKSHDTPTKWDMIIAFPPCTYLTNASAVRMRVNGEIQPDRYLKMMQAREFFYSIWNARCDRIAIENPTPMKICDLPPYSMVIQPYEFGEPYSKRTCLWLKGLPPFMATDIIIDHEPYVNGGYKDAHGNYRRFQGRGERDSKTRAKTFKGIAAAMANAWG